MTIRLDAICLYVTDEYIYIYTYTYSYTHRPMDPSTKYLLRECLGDDLVVKYLLKPCLD